MSVIWFSSLADAERELPPSPDAETGIRTALALARLDEATRRGVRVSPLGIQRFLDIGSGERERERYALAQLRRAADARGR
jgi:methylase of polypeptide subunit release factors